MKNYPSDEKIMEHIRDCQEQCLQLAIKDMYALSDVIRDHDEHYYLLHAVLTGGITSLEVLKDGIKCLIYACNEDYIKECKKEFINSYDENLKAARDEMNNPEKYRS